MFASLLLSLFFVGFSRAEPQCERINKTIPHLHLHCGYNYTSRFNYDHHFNSASRAIISLKSILKNCSAFVDIMVCSLFLPRCTEKIKGPYLPCRGVCYDYANECSEIIGTRALEWTVAMCDILPERDNPQTTQGYRERCFTPPNYKDSGKRKSTYYFSAYAIRRVKKKHIHLNALVSDKLIVNANYHEEFTERKCYIILLVQTIKKRKRRFLFSFIWSNIYSFVFSS